MKSATHSLVVLLAFVHLTLAQNVEEARTEARPHVVAVFPSADTLPSNLLRMYIQFSAPMRPIGNLERIRLVDDAGEEVVGAIFNNVHELWNHEQTLLTMLLDPSRVKTGLRSHEERGRSLKRGRRYSLVVGELLDVDGDTLAPFTKLFFVEEADFMPPNTDLWTFKTPRAGSQDPLIIEFPDMLDQLSLKQRLKLTDANSQPVAGRMTLASQERGWIFQPNEAWRAGEYLLYIHARLEDPAGNNLNGLFDHPPGTLKNPQEGTIETINFKITQ